MVGHHLGPTGLMGITRNVPTTPRKPSSETTARAQRAKEGLHKTRVQVTRTHKAPILLFIASMSHFLSPMYHHLFASSRSERGRGKPGDALPSARVISSSLGRRTTILHHCYPPTVGGRRRRNGRRVSDEHPPLPDDDDSPTHGQWQVWAVRSQHEQLLKKQQQGGEYPGGGIRSLEDGADIDPKVLRHMRIDTQQQQQQQNGPTDSSNEGFFHSGISALKPSRSSHDEAEGGDCTGCRRRASPRKAAAAAAVPDDASRRDRTSSGRR
jgi:hypothetical protein